MANLVRKYKKIPRPVKASLWFTISSILQKGISFITVPIFTRLLTPDQYGLFNVFNSWLSMITIFATLSLASGVFNNGMIRFEHDRDRFTSSMQSLATTSTFIFFVIYLLFRNFWNEIIGLPTLLVLVMFAEIFFTPALGFWSARQRFDYKYGKLVLLTLCISIANPVIGIIAVMATENKGVARILSAALVQICVCGVIYIYNLVKGKQFFQKVYWRYALAFNIPLIPHYLSGTVLSQADRIMINNLSGTDKAGIYSVAYSVAMLMTIVRTSINNSLIPWTYRKLKDQKYSDIGPIANFILVIIGGMVLALIAFAPEVVRILAPEEYYEAIWVIPPVATSVFFMSLYGLFANIEFYFEENIFIMAASIMGAILNIGLNFWLIPIFGYLAAGYTTLVCYVVFCFSHYFFMRKVCKKHISKGIRIYNVKFIILSSVGMLLASALLMTVYNHVLIRYLLVSIIVFVGLVNKNVIIAKLNLIKR